MLQVYTDLVLYNHVLSLRLASVSLFPCYTIRLLAVHTLSTNIPSAGAYMCERLINHDGNVSRGKVRAIGA
jgi:hypothetical protein